MATPVIRGTASGVVSSNNISFSASNYTVAPQAGDILILATSNDGGTYGGANSPIIFSGTGWTSGGDSSAGGSAIFAIWSRVATGTSADNVTVKTDNFDHSSDFPSGYIVAVSSASSINIGTIQGNFFTNQNITIPAQGNTDNLELIFQGISGNSTASSTISGFSFLTKKYNLTTGLSIWQKNLSTAGASVLVPPPSAAGTNYTHSAVAVTLSAPTPINYNLIVAPLPYQYLILQNSPILYLRMNTSSGTTVTDSSGNAINGTTVNSPTLNATGLVTGDSDTAMSFITNQYVSLAYSSKMNTSVVTFEVIVKPNAVVSGTKYQIICRDNYPTSRNWQVSINANGKFEMTWWDTSAVLWVTTGTTTLVAGRTYHLAATYDGTNSKVYVNGILEATVAHAGSLQTSSGGVLIGMYNDGFSQPFNGVIDEVAWYGMVLSADTILSHSKSSGR